MILMSVRCLKEGMDLPEQVYIRWGVFYRSVDLPFILIHRCRVCCSICRQPSFSPFIALNYFFRHVFLYYFICSGLLKRQFRKDNSSQVDGKSPLKCDPQEWKVGAWYGIIGKHHDTGCRRPANPGEAVVGISCGQRGLGRKSHWSAM